MGRTVATATIIDANGAREYEFLVDYHIRESLRYRVNPVAHALDRIPIDEPSPPYML